MSSLYIIAGPNGAGKTTAAMTLLPEVLHVREFVNADEIARGLSPFNAEAVSLQAGRLMLQRIKELAEKKEDFAFETTLASKNYASFIKEQKKQGYKVHLLFLWLPSADFAMKRVAFRVKAGGHHIPKETIVRRYHAGIRNLFALYMPLVDTWHLFDNSQTTPELIAKCIDNELNIGNTLLWQNLQEVNT